MPLLDSSSSATHPVVTSSATLVTAPPSPPSAATTDDARDASTPSTRTKHMRGNSPSENNINLKNDTPLIQLVEGRPRRLRMDDLNRPSEIFATPQRGGSGSARAESDVKKLAESDSSAASSTERKISTSTPSLTSEATMRTLEPQLMQDTNKLGKELSDANAAAVNSNTDEDEVPADPELASTSLSSASSPAAPPATFRSQLKGDAGTLLCGFIAGCVSRTSTAPLDRVKVLVQEGHNLHKMIQPKNPDPRVEASTYRRLPRCETPTVKEVLKYIYMEDGMKGYFKGNGVNCFKAGLESGVVFTVRKRLNTMVENRKRYEKTATYVNPFSALGAWVFRGGKSAIDPEPLQVFGAEGDASYYSHNVPTPKLAYKMISGKNRMIRERDGTERVGGFGCRSNCRYVSTNYLESGAPGVSLLKNAKTFPKLPHDHYKSYGVSPDTVAPNCSGGSSQVANEAKALAKANNTVLVIDPRVLPTTERDDHYKLFYYKQLSAVKSCAGGGGQGECVDPTIYFSVSSLPTLLPNFAVGSASGATAQILLYPLELIKTRIAVARKGEFSGGVRECIAYTYKSGGIREFYKGLTPNLAGIIPYRGLEVGIFFTVQGAALRRHRSHSSHSHKHLSALETAGIGTLASVIAQTATYPLNVIRTRLQTQGVNNRPKIYNGMTDCFMHLIKNEGVPGLFRGLTANYLKAVPASAITFVVYEEMQKMMGE